MNMTTTALWAFASWAREKVFPSTVVRVKSGAPAPIWGPAARTVRARTRTPAAAIRRRAGRMENFLLLRPATSPPPGLVPPSPHFRREGAGVKALQGVAEESDEEDGPGHHLVFLPDVLLPTVEEPDGDLVVGFDGDGFADLPDHEVFFGHRDVELLGLRQDLFLELLDGPDRCERGLLLHEVVEGRGGDLDGDD